MAESSAVRLKLGVAMLPCFLALSVFGLVLGRASFGLD